MECLRYQTSSDTENKTHDSSNKVVQGDSVMLEPGLFAAPDKVFPGLGFHHQLGGKRERMNTLYILC